jgi:hypothetical protein
MKNYKSAYHRLKEMSPVFSLRDLRLLQDMSPGTERNALARWKEEKYVELVGPKIGYYYNLVRDPSGRDNNLPLALKKIFKTVVVVGPSVLNNEGWTLQQPKVLTIAISHQRKLPQIYGVHILTRNSLWFDSIRNDIFTNNKYNEILYKLSPEYAFIDLLKNNDFKNYLAPDDIQIPEENDFKKINEAMEKLNVSLDMIEPYLKYNFQNQFKLC